MAERRRAQWFDPIAPAARPAEPDPCARAELVLQAIELLRHYERPGARLVADGLARWLSEGGDLARLLGLRVRRGRRALELASGGQVALAAGTFDGIESELRAALRAVAPAARARLALPAAVWRALTADVYAVVDAHEDVEGPMTADDAGWLGDFWYGVAAGEIRVAGPAEHAR